MKVLKDLFTSKKFLAALGGVLAVLLQKFLNVPEEMTMKMISLITAYIVGQGLADLGKEKAKIEKK